MSWRNQGITGSNNIPLGKTRRFGADDGVDGVPNGDGDLKRGRSPEPRKFLSLPQKQTPRLRIERKFKLTSYFTGTENDGPRRRKKRNRWGDAADNKAAGLMGLPTAISANMTSEQLEAYTLHLRIEEISQKLRINDVVPADGDRYVPCPLPHPPTSVSTVF